MEEQEQQCDLSTLRGEAVGIAATVALQQAVALEFSQIVAELVQAVSCIGELEGGQDSLVDFPCCPAARREKGLSRSGNGRVRKILIQLSWRMLQFQPDSSLVRWFKDRTANSQRSRKPMIVAFARKLIIALWRYVNTGVTPEGFKLAK